MLGILTTLWLILCIASVAIETNDILTIVLAIFTIVLAIAMIAVYLDLCKVLSNKEQ